MKIPFEEIEQFLSGIDYFDFEYRENSFEFDFMGTSGMVWNDRGLYSFFLSTPAIESFYLAQCVAEKMNISLPDATTEITEHLPTLDLIKKKNKEINIILESKDFRDRYQETYGLTPIQKQQEA